MIHKGLTIVPITLWNNLQNTTEKDDLRLPARLPVLRKVLKQRGIQLAPTNNATLFQKIISRYRIFVIEGVPGSGKDTFQNYLCGFFQNATVYDYSEGELLHSWKHVPIPGILDLRIKFMRLFVNYMQDIINRDKDAICLLNRFHLSAYITTVKRNPDLEPEYQAIVAVLKTLPVHVFIMDLNESELLERSSHVERSATWQAHQEQSVKKDGFKNALQRYKWQQTAMLEIAERQQIPFSVLTLIRNSKRQLSQIAAPKDQNAPPAEPQLTAEPLNFVGISTSWKKPFSASELAKK
jgi:thymidylate kinase